MNVWRFINMLYLIPTAAVIAALLLLLPARKNRDTGRARRRLVMNAVS